LIDTWVKGFGGNCQGSRNVGDEPTLPPWRKRLNYLDTDNNFHIYELICTARDYTNESAVIPVAMAMSGDIVRRPAALTRNMHNNRCSRMRHSLTGASSDCEEVDENRFGAQSYCFGRFKNWRTSLPRTLTERGLNLIEF
jgi:hypothetical protein